MIYPVKCDFLNHLFMTMIVYECDLCTRCAHAVLGDGVTASSRTNRHWCWWGPAPPTDRTDNFSTWTCTALSEC